MHQQTPPARDDAALVAAVRRILDDDPRTEAQMLREQVATLTRQLADALQQRDAAAENARREAKRSDMLGERIAGARLGLVARMDPTEVIDFLDVAIDEHTPKPRVAVVMSPRFVTQEQFDAALEEVWFFGVGQDGQFRIDPSDCVETLKDIMLPVSYTHLTLPTKRIV